MTQQPADEAPAATAPGPGVPPQPGPVPPGYGYPPPPQGQFPGAPGPYPYPYPYPYGYAPSPPTNTMAILALVFAFVFSPLGIVFGAIGLNQIKRTGEGGHGLALAGLIVGAVSTVLLVLYIIAMIAFFTSVARNVPQDGSTSAAFSLLQVWFAR